MRGGSEWGRGQTRALSGSASSSKADAFLEVFQKELEGIRAAGTYKNERVITSPQSNRITVAGGAQVINFCANNYLGLSDHPVVVEGARKALASHGFGLSSVRFICGTQDIHKQLEHKISEFHGTEDTILYASCFDANAGVFEGLLREPEDAIISDELNHASIIDGIRLCKASRYRYKHMDVSDLEDHLVAADQKGARLKMIATDGVFSMDGDIAPLADICDLADKYNALVFVDDCHATGFLGASGKGTPEHCAVGSRVDVINSTLGKALGGGTGGYTTGPKHIIDILRQRARPYLFSNSIPPAVVGASLAVFDLLSGELGHSLREALSRNTAHFRARMRDAGFSLGGVEHPIVPILLGDARLAAEIADDMLKRGIYVIGFSYPVVPKGKARIRVQLSAAHTLEDVDKCVDAFIEVGKAHRII